MCVHSDGDDEEKTVISIVDDDEKDRRSFCLNDYGGGECNGYRSDDDSLMPKSRKNDVISSVCVCVCGGFS